MTKWLDIKLSATIAFEIGNQTTFFDWDINTSSRSTVQDMTLASSNNLIVFYCEASKNSGVSGIIHILDKSDLTPLNTSWIRIIGEDKNVFEKEGIAIIQSFRQDSFTNPIIIIKENSRFFTYDNWTTDGNYSTISIVDLNLDGFDELIVTLSVRKGTGISVEKHI